MRSARKKPIRRIRRSRFKRASHSGVENNGARQESCLLFRSWLLAVYIQRRFHPDSADFFPSATHFKSCRRLASAGITRHAHLHSTVVHARLGAGTVGLLERTGDDDRDDGEEGDSEETHGDCCFEREMSGFLVIFGVCALRLAV